MRRFVWILLSALAPLSGFGLAVHGCAAVSRIPARGQLSGYVLQGPVDSTLARDYLEGRPLPAELAAKRRQYLTSGQIPSREELADLTRLYSTDVATLLLLETLSAQPDTRAMRRRYEAELAYVREVGIERARPVMPEGLLVLMVPGWFYRSNGEETNSDYRIQRRLFERWKIRHRLVPTAENGTVEDNARLVAEAIREESRQHRLLLVSASKSGAEVALALGRELRAGEAERVVGWLSIVGVLRGSPFADRALQPDLRWLAELNFALKGFDMEGLKSMRTARGRPAFEALHLPAHIKTYSYIAVPLSGSISERGDFGYGCMRELGPNDGLTLLADELLPGAVPLLAPGVDHFLDPQEQETWSTALFRIFAVEMAQRLAPRAAMGRPGAAAR